MEKGDNMVQELILDFKDKYRGKYVALTTDRSVICYGKNFKSVILKASKLGYANPIVFKVPDKNVFYMY